MPKIMLDSGSHFIYQCLYSQQLPLYLQYIAEKYENIMIFPIYIPWKSQQL